MFIIQYLNQYPSLFNKSTSLFFLVCISSERAHINNMIVSESMCVCVCVVCKNLSTLTLININIRDIKLGF